MIIKICLLFMLIFIPLQASNETTTIRGWYYVKVVDGAIGTLFKGTKKCYLKINEDKTEFTFSSIYESGYSVEARFVKEIEKE